MAEMMVEIEPWIEESVAEALSEVPSNFSKASKVKHYFETTRFVQVIQRCSPTTVLVTDRKTNMQCRYTPEPNQESTTSHSNYSSIDSSILSAIEIPKEIQTGAIVMIKNYCYVLLEDLSCDGSRSNMDHPDILTENSKNIANESSLPFLNPIIIETTTLELIGGQGMGLISMLRKDGANIVTTNVMHSIPVKRLLQDMKNDHLTIKKRLENAVASYDYSTPCTNSEESPGSPTLISTKTKERVHAINSLLRETFQNEESQLDLLTQPLQTMDMFEQNCLEAFTQDQVRGEGKDIHDQGTQESDVSHNQLLSGNDELVSKENNHNTTDAHLEDYDGTDSISCTSEPVGISDMLSSPLKENQKLVSSKISNVEKKNMVSPLTRQDIATFVQPSFIMNATSSIGTTETFLHNNNSNKGTLKRSIDIDTIDDSEAEKRSKHGNALALLQDNKRLERLLDVMKDFFDEENDSSSDHAHCAITTYVPIGKTFKNSSSVVESPPKPNDNLDVDYILPLKNDDISNPSQLRTSSNHVRAGRDYQQVTTHEETADCVTESQMRHPQEIRKENCVVMNTLKQKQGNSSNHSKTTIPASFSTIVNAILSSKSSETPRNENSLPNTLPIRDDTTHSKTESHQNVPTNETTCHMERWRATQDFLYQYLWRSK